MYSVCRYFQRNLLYQITSSTSCALCLYCNCLCGEKFHLLPTNECLLSWCPSVRIGCYCLWVKLQYNFDLTCNEAQTESSGGLDLSLLQDLV